MSGDDDENDAFEEAARERKRQRLRAPPLPEAHRAPDGRVLTELTQAEAAALAEVRVR